MTRDLVGFGFAAVALHGAVIFGLRPDTAPIPLPVGEFAVEVALVEAAPAVALASEEENPTQLPEEPVPPDPAPVVEPEPPPPEPEPDPPMALPEPAPTPPPPKRKPPRETTKPAPPNAQPRRATQAPTASRAAGAGSSHGTTTAAGVPGGNHPAKPRYNPKPHYPPESRRLRQEGRVIVAVQVTAEGRASSVTVKRSSGFPLLDAAAEQAVRRWSFEPARIGGLAVPSRAEVPVAFNLAQ